MSFRKRNIGISDARRPQAAIEKPLNASRLSGTRPSPVDGRFVTSTGVASLDSLFAGHGGQPLGTSIILEENGTTDYAGALLRFYAAEGLMQGHHVHVVGQTEQWGRELPDVISGSATKSQDGIKDEKLKIAWRYESLSQNNAEAARRERPSQDNSSTGSHQDATTSTSFCHTFDLSKRLVYPPSAYLKCLNLDMRQTRSCFGAVTSELSATLKAASPEIVHRILIPSLMSPSVYPPQSSLPEQILSFQHDLRELLAAYKNRLVIIQTLPLSLFPRTSGLTKWIELLTDGVFTLNPFPHSSDAEFEISRDTQTKEEKPQGLLRIHKLPVFHELGTGVSPTDMDWTFTLSRRKFTIKPFDLPPIENDNAVESDVPKEKIVPKASLDF